MVVRRQRALNALEGSCLNMLLLFYDISMNRGTQMVLKLSDLTLNFPVISMFHFLQIIPSDLANYLFFPTVSIQIFEIYSSKLLVTINL